MYSLDKIKNIKNSEENQFFDYKAFIETILKKVCLLPIQTKTLDSAMEIFETLNDRGLQLSDADIFKAKIYSNIENQKEQDEFANKWKEYTILVSGYEKLMQDAFTCYMFYIRAKEDNDKKNYNTWCYDFFLKKHPELLSKDNYKKTLENIKDIIVILSKIQYTSASFEFDDDNKWQNNDKIKKLFHIIKYYSNVWIRYPICVFFI